MPKRLPAAPSAPWASPPPSRSDSQGLLERRRHTLLLDVQEAREGDDKPAQSSTPTVLTATSTADGMTDPLEPGGHTRGKNTFAKASAPCAPYREPYHPGNERDMDISRPAYERDMDTSHAEMYDGRDYDRWAHSSYADLRDHYDGRAWHREREWTDTSHGGRDQEQFRAWDQPRARPEPKWRSPAPKAVPKPKEAWDARAVVHQLVRSLEQRGGEMLLPLLMHQLDPGGAEALKQLHLRLRAFVQLYPHVFKVTNEYTGTTVALVPGAAQAAAEPLCGLDRQLGRAVEELILQARRPTPVSRFRLSPDAKQAVHVHRLAFHTLLQLAPGQLKQHAAARGPPLFVAA